MPTTTIYRSKRFHICVLAALSITIMLFTAFPLHSLHHLLPSHHHFHPHQEHATENQEIYYVTKHPECDGLFYTDEILHCILQIDNLKAQAQEVRLEMRGVEGAE